MDSELRVRLTLTSDREDPGEVTLRTGLQPEKIWRAGDQIGKSIRKYEQNGWQLGSDRPAEAGFGDHVESLIAKVRPVLPVFRSLKQSWEIELSCAIEVYSSSPELHLEPDALQVLAELGASIDLDLYCLDDG